MNYWEVLDAAAAAAGVPTTHIGPAVGLNRAYVAGGRNRGGSPTVATAARLLGACGYVLAALPVDAVPDGALVLGPDAPGGGPGGAPNAGA